MKNSDLKILYTSQEIENGIEKLSNKLNSEFKDEELYVLCVLKGSVMFTVDLVKHLNMPVKMEFVRLSSYGSATESSGFVKAVDLSVSDLNNKNVLIVEDIVDSGNTAKFLVEYLNKTFNLNKLRFCSLLNKNARRKVDFEPDYYVFDVEDKFLVGYGMDYDGCYRNLPFVGYITI